MSASQCVLLFLSDGYFFSFNCLREVNFTLSKKLPLVLVYETDERKGGVSLDALRVDCASQIVDAAYLFDHHDLIPWHRVADFQQLSLVRIAKRMLHAMPAHRGGKSPPELYLTGGLLNQALRFHRPVRLYVSPSNPGASAMVEGLLHRFNDSNVRVLSRRPPTAWARVDRQSLLRLSSPAESSAVYAPTEPLGGECSSHGLSLSLIHI